MVMGASARADRAVVNEACEQSSPYGLPSHCAEDFLAQLRRVNAERYEAWATRPLLLCEHCGADENTVTENCSPPFVKQQHAFTREHPLITTKDDADIMFDAVELGGEVGELLNVVKKLEREDRGWRGSRADADDFADECADVLICLDKLARRRDVDLVAATIRKFNATSEKVGLPHKLTAIADGSPEGPRRETGSVHDSGGACEGNRPESPDFGKGYIEGYDAGVIKGRQAALTEIKSLIIDMEGER